MERPDLVDRVLALLATMSDDEVVALVRANLPDDGASLPDPAPACERTTGAGEAVGEGEAVERVT